MYFLTRPRVPSSGTGTGTGTKIRWNYHLHSRLVTIRSWLVSPWLLSQLPSLPFLSFTCLERESKNPPPCTSSSFSSSSPFSLFLYSPLPIWRRPVSGLRAEFPSNLEPAELEPPTFDFLTSRRLLTQTAIPFPSLSIGASLIPDLDNFDPPVPAPAG